MNIALTTIGSTGDLQPFLALGTALKEAGHRVRVCSHALFAKRFTDAGLEYAAAGPDFAEADRLHIWDQLDAAGDNLLRQFDILGSVLFFRGAEQRFQDYLAAMEGFDLAVCHHGDLVGQEAALRRGLPWIGVYLCPGFIETPLNPPLHAPDLGRWGNPLLWKLGALASRRLQTRATELLRALGTGRHGMKMSQAISPLLNFVPVSPALARVPTDLPPHFAVTGYWFHHEPAYTPPPELAEFLARKPAPVVISFGSMGGANGEETADLLVEAARLAGQRVVIQKGFANVQTARGVSPDQVHFADFTPHGYLFAHASCVAHHGGAGTTAAATRAGKPSVVIPHLADQLYWAKCLGLAGAALPPRSRRKLTAETLASMIKRTLEQPTLRQRAEALGKILRAEDGVDRAVKAIHGLKLKAGAASQAQSRSLS